MSTVEELLKEADEAFQARDFDKTKEICRIGIRQLEKSSDSASIKATIKFLDILSESDIRLGRWFDAIISLERLVRLADQQRDLIAKAEATITIGDLFSRSGKWDKARAKYEEALMIVKNFSNPFHLGMALAGMGIVCWRQANNMEAIQNGQRALKIGEEIENDELIGKAASLISSVRNDLGEYDRSLEVNEKAIEAYRRMGVTFDLARVLNNHGEIYKILDDFDEAIKTFNEALEIKGVNSNKRILGYLYFNLGECYVRKGDVGKAREMIDNAEGAMDNSEDKYLKAYVMMVKGMIRSKDGKPETALNMLAKAEDWMISLSIPYDSGIIVLEHALSLLEHGYRGEGIAKLKQANDLFKDADSKYLMEKTESLIKSNS